MKKKLPDIALGVYEAAAIMGVHWTRPKHMAASGKIICREIEKGLGEGNRKVTFFSFSSCEENYKEYDEQLKSSGGRTARRPRSNLADRAPMLRRLEAVKQIVTYADAVSRIEAAEILGVHPNFVPRMVASGRLVGRASFSPRTEKVAQRSWIISRRSCEENAASYRKEVAKGVRKGRPRANLKMA